MGAALLALCTSAACESNQINLSTETTVTWSEPIEMQTYTPQPIPITDVTVELPQDVIDDVVVGTVNPTFQQLADAALIANQATAAIATIPTFGSITGILPIDSVSGSPASGWTVESGNAIRVPYPGMYLVSITMPFLITDAPSIQILVRRAPSTTVGRAGGSNHNTPATGVTQVVGSAIVQITNPANDLIYLETAQDILSGNMGYNTFSISYLGTSAP